MTGDTIPRSRLLRRLFGLNLFFLCLMTLLRLLIALRFLPSGFSLAGLAGGALQDVVPVGCVQLLGVAWVLSKAEFRKEDAERLRCFHAGCYLLLALVLWADCWYCYYHGRHIDPPALACLERGFCSFAGMIAAVGGKVPLLATLAGTVAVVYGACAFFLSRGLDERGPAVPVKAAVAALCIAALAVGGAALRLSGDRGREYRSRETQAVMLNGVSAFGEACYRALWKESALSAAPDRGAQEARLRFEELFMHRTPVNRAAERRQPNVVLICVEGWGTRMLRFGGEGLDLTAELRKHLDEDLVWYNYYPAHYLTGPSLGVILTNRFVNIEYDSRYRPGEGELYSGAALPYERAGYETIAFGLNLFRSGCGQEGFTREFPRENLSDPAVLDDAWRMLSSPRTRPLFMMVYVDWNHEPYDLVIPPEKDKPELSIPDDDSELVSDGFSLQALHAARSTNRELARFLERVKSSPLGSSTIVAITGDHASRALCAVAGDASAESERVPFYLYLPPAYRPRGIDTSVYGSHLDVMPTLYRLSLSDAPYIAAGHDLCDPLQAHAALVPELDLVVTGDLLVDCRDKSFAAKKKAAEPNAWRRIPGGGRPALLLRWYNDVMRFSVEGDPSRKGGGCSAAQKGTP